MFTLEGRSLSGRINGRAAGGLGSNSSLKSQDRKGGGPTNSSKENLSRSNSSSTSNRHVQYLILKLTNN